MATKFLSNLKAKLVGSPTKQYQLRYKGFYATGKCMSEAQKNMAISMAMHCYEEDSVSIYWCDFYRDGELSKDTKVAVLKEDVNFYSEKIALGEEIK